MYIDEAFSCQKFSIARAILQDSRLIDMDMDMRFRVRLHSYRSVAKEYILSIISRSLVAFHHIIFSVLCPIGPQYLNMEAQALAVPPFWVSTHLPQMTQGVTQGFFTDSK